MNPLFDVVRRGWSRPLLAMNADAKSALRVAFLAAASRAGALPQLRRPVTAAELVSRQGWEAELVDGVRAWLELGVCVGELRRRGDRYSLRGFRARALARPQNDPIAAYYEELATLDHRLVMETPARAGSGDFFTITDAEAELIARSSRLSTPWIAAALEAAVPTGRPAKLVEVGCGSGAQIREAARLNPDLHGVGLELQPAAADLARSNLRTWGLDDRFGVEVGDVRGIDGAGDADLVTLHQNIYYFAEADQVSLLRHLASFLRPGGVLLITSMVPTRSVSSVALDLWGAMTVGAARLPRPAELTERMAAAGFVDVADHPLGVDGMFHAFTGRRA